MLKGFICKVFLKCIFQDVKFFFLLTDKLQEKARWCEYLSEFADFNIVYKTFRGWRVYRFL